MGTRYKSKIDAWVAALMGVAVVLNVFGLAVLVGSADRPALFIVAPLFVAVLGLMLSVLFQTHYTLSPTVLDVRSGPVRYLIPIASIKEIRPVRSVVSSPALSLDRLEISYDGFRAIMISPRDRERFLNELAALRGDVR